MKKFRLIAAFIVICSFTLTFVQAAAPAAPRVVFADAGDTDAPATEYPLAVMAGPVPAEDNDRWFAVIEGFFKLTTLKETAASSISGPADVPDRPEEADTPDIRTIFVEDTTYVAIRDFVSAIRPEAVFGYDAGMVTVSHEGMYMEFRPGEIYCYANGRILPLARPCFEQEDTFYVPIRTVAQIYAYDVAWNEDTQTATLFESDDAFESGADFYDYDDYMLLARVIRAESGNQPLEGKIAVGNVILNRVRSDAFPDTVSGVVYDRSCGIQFTTAYNGSLNKKPTEECLVAAKLCLEGYSVTDESLYFFNPRISTSSWIRRNCSYVTTIGDHAFYS